jgi:hypothetical protein
MSWYFDRAKGELVYLPNRRRYLSTSDGPPEALRFHIALTEPDARPDEPRQLRQPFIAASPPFSWVIE